MNPVTAAANTQSRLPDTPTAGAKRPFAPERLGGRVLHAEQVARYAWAAELTKGRVVLDAGCGVGHGSELIARAGAERVVGVEDSEEAVLQATAHATGVEFTRGELSKLPFGDGSFDVVVCFEVLGRLPNPAEAVRELRRVLRPGGIALISAANARLDDPRPGLGAEGMTPERLAQLLSDSFPSLRLEGQHLWAASLIGGDSTNAMSDPDAATATVRKLSEKGLGEQAFTLAIASDGPLPEINPLVTLVGTYEVRLWQGRIDELREELWAARQELEVARARDAVVDLGARRMASALEDVSAQNAKLHDAEGARDRAQLDAAQLAVRLNAAEYWLEAVQSSASWRITRPGRAVIGFVRRLARQSDPVTLQAPP